ncbi:hypothetical protein [Jiulongibacter sediminis]|uniref:hypothetical protein n=1 Tax=Jiulongibacter sediminis TaxID=1605367 RepID=UPI0026F36987|nr:hypothetical protein [Jiulongibacter sediminis]
MRKMIMSAGLWLIICACSTGRNAITTTPKTDNSSYKVVDVLDSNDEFQTVENAYEVANLDMAVFDKKSLMAEIDKINTYMGETGHAYLADKGIVVSFERGDIFGLTDYVPSNKAQSDYQKLVKALNTFEGTVIVAGKTNYSADGNTASEAHKRALKVAKFISKSSIDKNRILIDDLGVSFSSEMNRNARVKNDDRVVEFLIIPKRV